MTQHERLIDFLRTYENGVTTADFVKHPVLCAEYRARVSEARAKGYVISCERISDNNYRYRLEREPNGELFPNAPIS